MNPTFRLAALTAALAALPFASLAQVAQTVYSNGLGTTGTASSAGFAVVPIIGAPTAITSTVTQGGSTTVTSQTATQYSATAPNGTALTLGNGDLSLVTFNGTLTGSTGLRATPDNLFLGSFGPLGAPTTGFTHNGLAGTNGLVGDTTVTGDLTVTGITNTNGINNNGQVISNVASGVAASDVSTVGQLSAATAAQAAVNASQAAFNNNMQTQTLDNRRIASTGTAIVAAAASIPSLEAGKTLGLGVGVGGYDGRSAVSVALAARVSQSLQFKLHAGTGNGGKVAAGAGGLWAW